MKQSMERIAELFSSVEPSSEGAFASTVETARRVLIEYQEEKLRTGEEFGIAIKTIDEKNRFDGWYKMLADQLALYCDLKMFFSEGRQKMNVAGLNSDIEFFSLAFEYAKVAIERFYKEAQKETLTTGLAFRAEFHTECVKRIMKRLGDMKFSGKSIKYSFIVMIKRDLINKTILAASEMREIK